MDDTANERPTSAWGQEISDERKTTLADRFARQRDWAAQPADIRGASVFTGVELTGADVFWLAMCSLAGLDASEGALTNAADQLRSTDPLTRIDPDTFALHLEGAGLGGAHLEGAHLGGARLAGAILGGAHLEGADLSEADLEGANLNRAHLEGADLGGAHLEGAILNLAHLEGAILNLAHLEGAGLGGAHLEGAHLGGARLEGAILNRVHLEGANLNRAHLEGAHLGGAHLAGAILGGAHLEGADLNLAHLEGKTYPEGDADWKRICAVFAYFPQTLAPADLREAFLDSGASLRGAVLCGSNAASDMTTSATTVIATTTHGPRSADVRWGGVNLAVLDWTPFTEHNAILGDEQVARTWKPQPYQEPREREQKSKREQRQKWRATRQAHKQQQQQDELDVWAAAARANRQLATALRDQGMNDEADYFAYRAQVTQRGVLQRRRQRGRWLFSGLLDLLAGYGYRAERSLRAYLLVIAVFTGLYLLAGDGVLTFGLTRSAVQPLRWYEALVLSVSSFHGRGFFQPLQNPGDPVAILAAVEAVFGLIIEISFIATFTQRYFGGK